MAKILVTGSTEGLGLLTAKKLISQGNEVVLHARNEQRAAEVKQALPQVKNILIGDLSSRKDIDNLAKQINKLGSFDAIIHNAGVYTGNAKLTFQVNVLAPYLLTMLVKKPKRLIFVSSGMHVGSHLNLDNLMDLDYSGSKLQILLLTKVLARLWPNVTATAVDPGWVPTRMGGAAASDDLTLGYTTQVWLATLNNAFVSGNYYHHMKLATYDRRADDETIQDRFLTEMQKISGVNFAE